MIFFLNNIFGKNFLVAAPDDPAALAENIQETAAQVVHLWASVKLNFT